MKKGKRLYINITNSCNAECPFCCMYSSPDNSDYMSFDTYKKIIDDTKSTFELQLEGGEPLLHKDLYLFIEYAISTDRCSKVIILSNGILLDKHLKRLISIHNYYSVPVEIKVSVNYYLLSFHEDHLRKLSEYIFAIENIPDFDIKLNVRKRKEVDEQIDQMIEEYHLTEYANSYYLQSYGKLTDTNYAKPVIVQNIEEWEIFATDGTSFGTDLIARSNYEGAKIKK